MIPKYRRKVFYGRLRRQIGAIMRDLCRQRGVELLEGHAMPDHLHLCLSIPPKYSVAFVLGFLKGKSAVRIHRELLHERRMSGLSFWARATASARSGWMRPGCGSTSATKRSWRIANGSWTSSNH
jgi:putative transposase